MKIFFALASCFLFGSLCLNAQTIPIDFDQFKRAIRHAPPEEFPEILSFQQQEEGYEAVLTDELHGLLLIKAKPAEYF